MNASVLRCRRVLGGWTAGLLLAFVAATAKGQSYNIVRLGLFSAAFTDSSGRQNSGFEYATSNGYEGGYSNLYNGLTDLGLAVWLTNAAGVTTRVGLFSAGYIQTGGYQLSTLYFLNTSGYAAGVSESYSGTVDTGQAVWSANAATGATTRIGFSGTGYTQTGGYQYSSLQVLTTSGYAGGGSERFSGANDIGTAAWIANVSTGVITRVGLTVTAPYTASDGTQTSTLQILTEGGYAGGFSDRYSGTNWNGAAAWVANASTGATTRVGFSGTGYVQTGGYQYSNLQFLNESGYAGGVSQQFNGATDTGVAAWVANVSTGATTRVGFSSTAYTDSNGYQSSTIQFLTGSYAGGISEKYSGTTDLGSAAWVANASTGATTRIGFFDSAYTQTSGYQSSTLQALTASGYVGGVSERFSGANDLGTAVWVASASTAATTRIGFSSGAYTDGNGYQSSALNFLTASGYAGGVSERFSGSVDQGPAVWLANASTGTTTRVGFSSAAYTATDGTQTSTLEKLTESGYAGGTSQTYSGPTVVADIAWVAGAISGATTRVGSSGTAYTRNDGYQYSAVQFLTESGYAAGTSNRYTGANQVGSTAWIYDTSHDAFTPLVFSIRASDGYASSDITQLSESGLAIGQYELFNGTGTDLGARAFAWTPGQGAFDLGSVVNGGLSATGWAALNSSDFANALEQIIGDGQRLSNGGSAVFLLVPEPSAALLGLLGLLSIGLRRRREPDASGRPQPPSGLEKGRCMAQPFRSRVTSLKCNSCSPPPSMKSSVVFPRLPAFDNWSRR
jgi:MYXO-CTERM domain-containing protein